MIETKPVFAYRPQLDGLRFICIIITIFNHVQGSPKWINGSTGVDIFFALSGFLITTLLVEEFQKNGSISIRAFYIRRICRIAPLYFLAVVVTAMAAFALAHVGEHEKLSELSVAWPWILTFNREYCPVGCGTYFGHAWTIGIEEKFYILWPLIFAPLFRKDGVKWIAAFLVLISAVLFICSDDPFKIRGYLGIIFGCLAGLWYFKFKRELGGAWLWTLVIFANYWLLGLLQWRYQNLLISAPSALLIISLVHRPTSRIAKLLGNPVTAFLGKLTYGIYLFHVLVINIVEMVLKSQKIDIPHNWAVVAGLGYGLTVCTAYLLYILVEKPAIQAGRAYSKSEPLAPKLQ